MAMTPNQQAMGLAALLFTRGGLSCEFTFTESQLCGLEILRQAKAVLPGPTNARDAMCAYCGLHRGPVLRADDGLIVQCPDCGPYPLDPASQRTWRFDDDWLIRKLRGALDIAAHAPIVAVADGVWDIGRHKRRSVVLGRRIDLIERHGLRIFHGPEPREQSWVITPKPLGKPPQDPLAGTATWWQLEDRFALHGLALRPVAMDEEQGIQVNEPAAPYTVHGPFTADFSTVMLDDWPHGAVPLSEAQARLFAALWKLRREPQTAEVLMREAGLARDRPMDVFKVKAANRGDPVYEGLLRAYERLVNRQRRLGLYQLVWPSVSEQSIVHG
jgi:hypothetical protein